METSANCYNLAYLERLYADYTENPDSVPPDYRSFFEQQGNGHGIGDRFQLAPDYRRRTLFRTNGHAYTVERGVSAADQPVLQERVAQLIRNFRVRGHTTAQIDPLGRPRPESTELNPFHMGFTEADMDKVFSTVYIGGPQAQTLRQIIQRLRNTYCRSIAVQFMHIDDLEVRTWLQERMETSENHVDLTRQQQLRILKWLTDAVVFEQFLARKFVGAKTFSLEGAETLIPLLDLAIEKGGTQGVDEVVIGMAHRGRLNVLANIMGKSPQEIFHEFADKEPEKYLGGGDVKYHLGYSSDWKTAAGHKVHLSLCFNPSHLEFINPVAMGRTRAKQDRVGDTDRRRGLVVMIHGDSAMAGEGIVQETLNLSQLPAYTTGGALHIVINNQVGFTTLPQQYRSCTYSTDVARLLQVPIFHVNGEDPEAVAQVINLAMDFRKEFQQDVFIDMYCFRRRGHNEGDEPQFTQPLMYQTIERRKTVRESYLDRLLALGGMTRAEAEAMEKQRTEKLEKALTEARGGLKPEGQKALQGVWSKYVGGPESNAPQTPTTVPQEKLARLLKAMTRLPDDFHPHPKIERLLEARKEMAAGSRPLDWATAEALAFASLAVEGHRVRMTGQDSERGTFSQRHSVLHDIEDGHTHSIFQNLDPKQAPVEIANSALSEAGVLGFEYGYSLDYPDGLILWEAQFGDFVNVAQVIIDQFISSAEDKWPPLSGLTMPLPHGFEGQGPEHSSARLERFLFLCAEDNMQVAYPSTPAQYFHMLRRQKLRPWLKPLVVMTPKSLLRLSECSSRLDDLATGSFHRVLDDDAVKDKSKVSRVLLCTGKIYYDLAKRRQELKRDDIAIIRLEQLYPFPHAQLQAALAGCKESTPVYWVQEEPRNMGAWPYLRARLGHMYERFPLHGISRPESASPATGSPNAHKIEQELVISSAFEENPQKIQYNK